MRREKIAEHMAIHTVCDPRKLPAKQFLRLKIQQFKQQNVKKPTDECGHKKYNGRRLLARDRLAHLAEKKKNDCNPSKKTPTRGNPGSFLFACRQSLPL